MKNVSEISKTDKSVIEEMLNNQFYDEDFTISLSIDDNSVSLSLEHDNSLYTKIDFKIFHETERLLNQFGYKLK